MAEVDRPPALRLRVGGGAAADRASARHPRARDGVPLVDVHPSDSRVVVVRPDGDHAAVVAEGGGLAAVAAWAFEVVAALHPRARRLVPREDLVLASVGEPVVVLPRPRAKMVPAPLMVTELPARFPCLSGDVGAALRPRRRRVVPRKHLCNSVVDEAAVRAGAPATMTVPSN